MDPNKVRTLLEDLEVNIDELEVALEPLITKPLAQSANNLPLLDRAKLFATTAYAIESLIFNALKVAGIEPSEHPVKTELDRVKTYFAKIKDAENPERRNLVLDKQAAGRFIKAALSGNDRYDREREDARQRNKSAALQKMADVDGKKRRLDGEDRVPDESKRVKSHGANVHAQKASTALDSSELEIKVQPAVGASLIKKKSNKPPKTAKEVAEALKMGSANEKQNPTMAIHPPPQPVTQNEQQVLAGFDTTFESKAERKARKLAKKKKRNREA